MITDSAILELRDIIAQEKGVVLELADVRRIAESLIGLYSSLVKVKKETKENEWSE